MKKFADPSIEIIKIGIADVITTSGEIRDPDEGGDAPLFP